MKLEFRQTVTCNHLTLARVCKTIDWQQPLPRCGEYDMLPARRPDSPKAPSVPHGTEDAVPLSEKAEKNGRGTVKEKRTVRNAKVKKTKAKNKGMSM